jgi:hypothetical protein
MDNTLCIVSCQYYNENGKPKGEQTFQLRVDSDLFMYAPERLIGDAINELIQKEWSLRNYAGRVEYRSHELVFHEPMVINSGSDLSDMMTSLYDQAPIKYK